MQVSAHLKNANISAQKMRLVADMIRGLDVEKAIGVLAFCQKKAAKIVKKVLESAIANAENNEGADVDELHVSTIYVDEGPVQKRIKPRAKGRADRILRRSCHLSVIVSAEDKREK